MALNNVPVPGETLLHSRDLINANFVTYIDAQFKVDHQEFNSGGNSGKHNKVTMPQQPAAPPAFLANEMGFYVTNNISTAQSEIFIRRAPNTDIPFTAGSNSLNGWCYLPSGVLIKWGSHDWTNPAISIDAITFAQGPAYTNIWNEQITIQYPVIPGRLGNIFSYSVPLQQITVILDSPPGAIPLTIKYFIIGA